MESPSVAGPSQPISLSGTTVGQLDATQASRVLSVLEAKLSFASYDPYTAYADPPTLSAKDIPPKRIVIETLPNGRSTWRWVPRAKGVESIADEGSWPRIIDICGQQVLCSQEQWDIYKLDPAYDCTVHPAPHLTTITPRKSQDKRKASSDAGRGKRPKGYSSDEGSPKSPHAKKPRIHEADSDSDAEHTDSDDEVEDIILDDSERAWREAMKTARRERIQKRREERWEKNIVRNRKLQEAQDVSMIDLTADDEDSAQSSQPAFPETTPNGLPSDVNEADSNNASAGSSSAVPPSNMPGSWAEFSPPLGNASGTESSSPQSSGAGMWTDSSSQTSVGDSGMSTSGSQSSTRSPQAPATGDDAPSRGQGPTQTASKKIKREADSPSGASSKRMRTVAPSMSSAPQSRSRNRMRGEPKTAGRFSKKASFMETRKRTMRFTSEDTFRKAFDGLNVNGNMRQAGVEEREQDQDPVSLEEKIRRIQEINAYEAERARIAREAARLRAEEAENEKRRRQQEQWAREREQKERERHEREQEQARRRQQQREEQERLRKQREAEEAKRRQQQKEAEERRRRQQQDERWTLGPWTTQRALERYKTLAEVFDTAQFNAENPITFITIPWPVLHRPNRFRVEDIDWQSVEQFFEEVKVHMRSQDYKTFVEKSHRRFHPDRWRARRVLQSIEDEELKACLEVAANTVAQALTPIWREAKKG